MTLVHAPRIVYIHNLFDVQLWVCPKVESEDFLVHAMKGYRWSSCLTPLILSLDTIWRRVVIHILMSVKLEARWAPELVWTF